MFGELVRITLVLALACASLHAQTKPRREQNLSTDDLPAIEVNDREAEFYRIVDVPLPPDAVVEAGSMLELPDGRLVVGTRRGEVYFATAAETTPPAPKWKLFATGLTEILGLAWRDGVLYVTQQGEVTRLIDTDGDGGADRFETVSDAWAWGGEHEFNFGSNFDKDGAIWTLHGLTGSYTSERPFRGWALRHFPDGRWEAMCSGLRSPGGIAFNAAGDVFYVESQGPWASANMLKQLKPGGFMGHPIGNKWYDLAPNMGPRPAEPTGGDTGRRHLDAQRIPQLVLPSVVLPYKKMGQSASAIMLDVSGGKFGPFAGQFFIGDYTLSLVMRAEMEKVNGAYQGACYPFRQGFATGLIGGTLTRGGHIFVGGSKRGWPVRGLAPYALQRLDWNGNTPFEIHSMRVQPDGFELRLTAPADNATASDPRSYTLETFTHHYFGAYGGPEIEQADQRITRATVSADGLTVHLVVDKLVVGHIHELHLPGLRDRAGKPLVHDVAYYTLNQIPAPR
jgi:glucose/arabinose dehydrogenase